MSVLVFCLTISVLSAQNDKPPVKKDVLKEQRVQSKAMKDNASKLDSLMVRMKIDTTKVNKNEY